MRSLIPTAIAAIVVLVEGAGTVRAQDVLTPVGTALTPQPAAGWTFTPSFVYAANWDDNVLIRGVGDQAPSDVLNVLGPRADLAYTGKRTHMTLDYDGGLLMYRNLNSLDNYEQHAVFETRRMITPHVVLFVRDLFAAVPTTSMVQFVGVPFVATGSKMDEARGGAEVTMSKRLSFIASANYDWVKFDDPTYSALLLGGHSFGGTVTARYILSDLNTLTADYDVQHADVAGGPLTFDIQNTLVGLERKLSDVTRVFGGFGYSRLNIGQSTNVGPAWRLGMAHTYRTASFDVNYSQSFVPQYGFGGTLQNEEISSHVQAPLARRVTAAGSVAWRKNQSLVVTEPTLNSFWFEASVGYAVSPWLRVEGFYSGVRQTIDRPGGQLNRNVVGVQFTTAKTMRIR